MGRINVTIRIFEGTLVPNKVTHAPTRAIGAQRLACHPNFCEKRSKDPARMGNESKEQTQLPGPKSFVTVLAQDHCYSDLLRFVPTINLLIRSAMTSRHCPSA